MQVMHAPDSNRPLFAYRQVKPIDTAIVRAALEAFLMSLISMIVLGVATLLGAPHFQAIRSWRLLQQPVFGCLALDMDSSRRF